MIDKIVLEIFEKAEKICSSNAKSALAEHICNEIEKKTGVSISERTLIRAFEKYLIRNEENTLVLNTKRNIEEKHIGIPVPESVKLFCNYLGYNSYQDYVSRRGKKILTTKNLSKFQNLGNEKKERKWFLPVALMAIISILTIILLLVSGIGTNVNAIANQCMVWNNDRFVPIECDASIIPKLSTQVVDYNEDLINNFRKVGNKEMRTYENGGMGKHLLWYGESIKGNREYFTSSGFHPITGEPLHEVTPKMIEQYLLTNNKKNDSITNEFNKEVKRERDYIHNPIENSIGVFIFNNQKSDPLISNRLENTIFKSYLSMTDGIALDTFSKEKLLRGNVSNLNNHLVSKIYFICVGTIKYNFKKSKISSNNISCELILNYNVYFSRTGAKLKNMSQSIIVFGTGFSEEQAKQNAVNKVGNE